MCLFASTSAYAGSMLLRLQLLFLFVSALQAADVYALGIMMWELYTGEDAFQRLQHPGQFFETVVLQDLRPVIPHGEQ